MSKRCRIVLILVAVVCFAVALSYPILYSKEQRENDEGMARLAAIREAGLRGAEEETAVPVGAGEAEPATKAAVGAGEAEPATKAVDSASDETLPAAQESETFSGEAPKGAQKSAVVSNQAPQVVERSTTLPSAARESVAPLNEAATPARESTEVSDKAPAAAQNPAVQSDALPEANLESKESPNEAPQVVEGTQAPKASVAPTGTPEPTATIAPTPTPDRRLRTGKAKPYPEMEKVVFDEADILPEFEELYAINHDLVGWITIPGTVVDYPVVQCDNSEFYLKHDFYGEKNHNGQIIMDSKCDPYTPSYNLVVSGHSMKSGSMFGSLVNYMYESYWKRNKMVQMDVLTEHREYVIFAAFFSADYDVDEEGFRYNVDIQYRLDMDKWLEEIRENQLYDTGIDVEFGDEFLTLTTCSSVHRKNGRFVLVCRRVREGEEIE